ncbi:MATE family efflux transporter [Bradyrhizobium sp. Tv2a-2]|uniref:MATE family efflux transporter n=1 Tax=Bradyrhizobium sp. Tv2a-2 TaxID=113395 RepID=UPI0003FB7C4A|nr:MATE family efflux transporter [Bradyrhizobium sp. Tv2a-2]
MDRITERKSTSASRLESIKRESLPRLASELSETAGLALPMVLTQIGQIVMMTIDLAFIGRIGADALAAAALAMRIYLVGFTLGLGLLAPIAPLAAQAYGADNLAAGRRMLRMGLWTALLAAIPITAFALQSEQMLLALGQTPDTARLACRYLSGLAWSVAPALCFQAIRNFMGGINRPQPILWITLAAVPVDALLVYLLAYGRLGLPRLDLFGAGVATTLVNSSMLLAALWFAIRRLPFRDYNVLAEPLSFDWTFLRQLIVIGTPTSITALMGSGTIAATAFLAGWISTNALAVHQIALQIGVTFFMISFGISVAAAVRVGHAVGSHDGPGARRAGLAAMLLGAVIAATLTLSVLAGRFELAELFLGGTVDHDATIRLTARLLCIGASFFVIDAVGSIAAGALRGLNDTRVPLLFVGLSHWLIGFSLSYVLALKMGLGVIGIWIGLSIGATIYAALLVLRFELLTSRLARQTRGV